MEIIRTKKAMQKRAHQLLLKNQSVGLVPTMGYFHEGHLALMEQAKKENDVVVVSIFVNPLQFGPNEDFEHYPRDEERDIKLAEEVGVDIVFVPSADEMYPTRMAVTMSVKDRVNVLCGKKRPGHFDGVITVLSKLFHLVEPKKAYFGLKDAQQVAVVAALINDLDFPVELAAIPTIRESNGLAKSSRNVNLSQHERKQAPAIYKALHAGRQLVVDGEKNPAIIVNEVIKIIDKETSGRIDYVELLSYPALKPVSSINQQVILATAVQFERARLIDNLIFDENGIQTNHIS